MEAIQTVFVLIIKKNQLLLSSTFVEINNVNVLDRCIKKLSKYNENLAFNGVKISVTKNQDFPILLVIHECDYL